MKKETKEYNYDWMMWSLFNAGSQVMDGSKKEYESLLSVLPNFTGILNTLLRHGEPGVLFLKMLAEYLEDIVTAHAKGKKLCLGTFVMAKHIIFAFENVVPVWAEPMTVFGTLGLRKSTYEYMDYCCEVGFTETSCSAQRGSLGSYLAGLAEMPDFMVCGAPGICDTNANAVQFVSSYLDLPLFQLNFPAKLTDERVIDYHSKDMKALIAFIEEHAGEKISEDKLRGILEEQKVQDELCCEFYDYMRLTPCPAPPIFNFFQYGGRLTMPGRKCYTELLRSMLKVMKKNAEAGIAGTRTGKERARLMMCYIEHYTTDGRFWEWLDSQEISLLPALIFTFWHEGVNYAEGRENEAYHIDTSNMDSMVESLASINARMPMVKQLRGPYDAPQMWLDDLRGLVKTLKPDFLTYVGSMGCRNSWGANKLIQRDMEREGIPTMLLFADAFDDRVASWESCVEKLSEFMKVRRITS